MIDLAEQGSFLIRVSAGGKDKNSKRVDRKYQLNGMLAPHWDLPISRRGTLLLRASEADTIFSSENAEDFERLIETRVRPMTAPYFGKRNGQAAMDVRPAQSSIFDSE